MELGTLNAESISHYSSTDQIPQYHCQLFSRPLPASTSSLPQSLGSHRSSSANFLPFIHSIISASNSSRLSILTGCLPEKQVALLWVFNSPSPPLNPIPQSHGQLCTISPVPYHPFLLCPQLQWIVEILSPLKLLDYSPEV